MDDYNVRAIFYTVIPSFVEASVREIESSRGVS
jgi:hypothetical protein